MRLALLLFWLAFAAQGADFDKGGAAYEAGDYATALREFKPFAEKGIAVMQFVVGSMYAGGMGVPQDNREAIRWFRLAGIFLPLSGGAYVEVDARCDFNGVRFCRESRNRCHLWAR